MKKSLPFLLLLSTLSLSSCGSVSIPDEHYYRLRTDGVRRSMAEPQLGAIRVDAMQLDAGLASDRLLVADTSQVRLIGNGFHRWAGPLPRLVQDAVRTGLSRTGVFADVKGPLDEGSEQLLLTGRILDFHQVAAADRWASRVTLELRAYCPELRQVVFQEEFTATVSLPEATPVAAVKGLSSGLAAVVQQFVERCQRWSASPGGLRAKPAQPGK